MGKAIGLLAVLILVASALLPGHGHGRQYGVLKPLDVVRVDEQRLLQLVGGAG